ncbi:hypothetical protein DB41_FN00030 [Neochlamydia sp. TUME1]|nr:hypothetical protein DB41_FN00030 [Neochlamydia sp. TUME1]
MIIHGLYFALGSIHESIKELTLILNSKRMAVLLVLNLLGIN